MADTSNARLKILVFTTTLIAVIMFINGYFMTVETTEEGYVPNELALESNQTTEGLEEGNAFIDFFVGAFNLLTFANIDNAVARAILGIFTGSLAVVTGYLTYSFIRDWIPLV